MSVRVAPNLVVVLQGIRVRIVSVANPDYVDIRTPEGRIITVERRLLEREALPLEDPDSPRVSFRLLAELEPPSSTRNLRYTEESFTKKCKSCNKPFKTNDKQKTTCSRICRKHRHNVNLEKRTRSCLFCEKEFETVYPTQCFCGNQCRRSDHSRRQKEARLVAKTDNGRALPQSTADTLA